MIKIKLNKQINEMALGSYKTIGDFEKPGPFRGVDHKMVTHPGYLRKLTKFFSRTPFNFNLWMSNIPGHRESRETGEIEMPEFTLKKMFPKHYQEMLDGTENSITIIFLGNSGDRKVMMTPWIVAHRIGHAFRASGRFYNNSEVSWIWKRQIDAHIFLTIDNNLEDIYGIDIFSRKYDRYDYQINEIKDKLYRNLFHAIGTQKSSRERNLPRHYEFIYECFAQYIMTGHVKLNPFPETISLGTRRVFGKQTDLRKSRYSEEERKEVSDNLARDFEYYFAQILKAANGKIFLM